MTTEPSRFWTVEEIDAANQAAHARDKAILAHECWLYGTEIVGLYLLLGVERLLRRYEEEKWLATRNT